MEIYAQVHVSVKIKNGHSAACRHANTSVDLGGHADMTEKHLGGVQRSNGSG